MINQNGVSLMETVVAASISIIIAMGVVRINQNASKGMSRIMTKNDIVDFKQDLKRKISIVDETTGDQTCYKNVGKAFGTDLKTIGVLGTTTAEKTFRADGAEETFTVGKSIPSAPALKLIKATRLAFNSGAIDSNQGRCDIELEVSNTRNTTEDKTFIIKIPMVCGIVDKSAGNYTMTSCTASNSSLDEGLGKMIQDGANRDIMAFEGGTGGAFMVIGDTSLADLDTINSTLTLLPKAGVNDKGSLGGPSAIEMIAGSTLGWNTSPPTFGLENVGLVGNKTPGYLDLIAQQIDLYASSSTPITLKSGSINTNGGGISTDNGQIRTYDGAIQTTSGSFISSSGNFTTTTGSISTGGGNIEITGGGGSIGISGTGGIRAYGDAGIQVRNGVVTIDNKIPGGLVLTPGTGMYIPGSTAGILLDGTSGMKIRGDLGISFNGSAGMGINGGNGISMAGTLSAGRGLYMPNGDITSRSIYTVGVMYTSDERLKKEIDQLGFVSDKLENIRGVTYFMRADEFPDMSLSKDRQIGLLAQEVELFFPELVKVNPTTGFKSVSYAGFVPILLEAVKEQRAEALENRKMLKFLERRASIKDNEQDIRIEALERENKQLKLELKELRRKLDLLLQERLE